MKRGPRTDTILFPRQDLRGPQMTFDKRNTSFVNAISIHSVAVTTWSSRRTTATPSYT